MINVLITPDQVWRSKDYRDHGREVKVVRTVPIVGSMPSQPDAFYVEVENVATGRNTCIRSDVFRRRYELVDTEEG